MEFAYCKLEIFIPETHLGVLQRALQEADAGHIGNYDCCLSYSPVTGCWRPLEGTAPYLGSIGEISSEPELKVEVTCRTGQVDQTIAAIKKVHPYEEPVINVIPLYRTSFISQETRAKNSRKALAFLLFFPVRAAAARLLRRLPASWRLQYSLHS